jgi:hypothetical protein
MQESQAIFRDGVHEVLVVQGICGEEPLWQRPGGSLSTEVRRATASMRGGKIGAS